MKRGACWVLSNLMACGPLPIAEFVSSRLHLIIKEMLHEASIDIVREAAWVISNSFSKGSNKQIRIMLEDGLLSAFMELLSISDTNVRCLVLDTVNKLLSELKDASLRGLIIRTLQESQAIQKIEEFQTSSNKVTSEIAAKIICKLSTESEDMLCASDPSE